MRAIGFSKLIDFFDMLEQAMANPKEKAVVDVRVIIWQSFLEMIEFIIGLKVFPHALIIGGELF